MKRLVGVAAAGWLALAGCATVPTVVPQAVIDARAALELARKAKADLLVPEEYREAQRLLDQTESSFSAEQTIATVEDLAFQAQSQAQIAEARALTRQLEQEYEAAQQNLIAKQNFLMILAGQAKAAQDARELSKLSEAQRKEAERLAAEAQQKAAAAEKRRKELEQLLAEAQAIPGSNSSIRGEVLVINLPGQVLFNTGSAQLQGGAKTTLDHVGRFLKKHADYRVRIEGHTDSTGTVEGNNILSQARAESVVTYLTQQGVPLDSLKAVGMGSAQPVATNDTSAGRQLNRRVEIMLEKKIELESQP